MARAASSRCLGKNLGGRDKGGLLSRTPAPCGTPVHLSHQAQRLRPAMPDCRFLRTLAIAPLLSSRTIELPSSPVRSEEGSNILDLLDRGGDRCPDSMQKMHAGTP